MRKIQYFICSQVSYPNSEKPESPLSETKLVGTDFTPLIQKASCLTLTWKFRNVCQINRKKC